VPSYAKIPLILLAIYALIVLAAWLGQRKLMYFPDRTRTAPSAIGLPNVEEQVIETPDGARVLAWWGRARPGQPTLLYFHGNAGSFLDRAERFRSYLARGRGMLMMTYRGYGGSTGSPSEAANVADAKLAYRHLLKLGVRPEDVILYGESLGSGIAVQVAAEHPVGGLILDAPYTSAVDLAASVYPFLPVRALMTDRYETLRYIAKVRAPILVVHGDRDRVIPLEMGRAVYAAARGPKRIEILPGAGHVNHAEFGSFERINAWIDEIRRR
jgi:hypothetical protein